MALKKFNCKVCNLKAVHAQRGSASCSHCGAQYEIDMRVVSIQAAIMPIALFLAFVLGQWWVLAACLAGGLYLSIKAERTGSAWRLVRNQQ